MGAVRRQFSGAKVAGDDAGRLAVDLHHFDHLVTVVELDSAVVDLLGHGLVRAEQQLLAGLPPGVKRSAYLRSTEGAVGKETAVFTGEGYAGGNGLVDDVD